MDRKVDEIWSCYHKNNTPDKNYKPLIVVRILNLIQSRVLVNTYDNFFPTIIENQELVFNYKLK